MAGAAEPRLDVYALAVTLHTLLTGYQPSVSDLVASMQSQRAALPAVRQLNPAVRPAVEQAIQRATAPDVTAPSARELLVELESLLARPGVPLPPRPTAPPEAPGFVGRAAELAFFKEQLAAEHLVVISGVLWYW